MENNNEQILMNTIGSLISQQQLIEPQIKLTHIKSNHYFTLINKKYNQALIYRQKQKYVQQHAKLDDINENDINQIFQIQEIKDDKFEIVHGMSTLVFTRKQTEVMLDFGSWKQTQFFYPEKINSSNSTDKLYYSIKENKKSNKYLYYDGFALRCETISPEDERAIWEIKLCLHNKTLNKSCWIQNVFSNQVIDIPGATDRPHTELIQYPCNYRFNQRFFIEELKRQEQSLPSQKLFTIQSLKTSLYISVSQGPFSVAVIQDNRKKEKSMQKQLWKIEYVGNGLYMIRSAIRPKMFLAVKERSTKIQQLLTITDKEEWCLWKIVGNFNIMPNKDFKF